MKKGNAFIFNSINDIVNALETSEPKKDRETESDKSGSKSWCDTKSYAEALECLQYGKKYPLADEIVKSFTKVQGEKTKTVMRQSVVGHNVVVPLFLNGVPNCMVSSKKTINNKVITIFYSCQAPWHVDKEDIEKTTFKLLEHILSLEKQGYRVNLYVIEVNPNYGGFGFGLRIKTDREPFNISKMVFPLCSSSFLRRIGFRVKERLYEDWIGGGYGTATFEKDLVKEFIKLNFKTNNYEVWDYEGKQIG